MRKAIDTAPRNGEFVILEDAVSGAYTVARWSSESSQWLDDEGTPSRFNATHWHPPQTTVGPVNEIESFADSSGWSTTGGTAAQPRGGAAKGTPDNAPTDSAGHASEDHGKIPPPGAAARGGNVRWRYSILMMAACLLAGAAIDPLLYQGELGKLLLAQTAASENETSLRHALREGQEPVTKLASDAMAARREVEQQAALLREAGEAAGRQKEADDRTIVQLRQALQLELSKAEKLAGELAEAQRDSAAQTSLARKASDQAARVEAEKERIAGELQQALKQQEDKAAQATLRTTEQVALKQERDKAEKLRAELAAARREGESRAVMLRAANDEITRQKETSARTTGELRQALQQAQDKAERLAGELVAARQEVEAGTAAARAASDEARRAMETNRRDADEQGRALREAQGNVEKLTAELAAARREAEAQAAAAAAASDETRRAAETNRQSADEQGEALREAQDKARKLAAELAAARKEAEAQTVAAAAASDEAGRAAEANRQSADEQGRALREAEDKAGKLAAELAAARREIEANKRITDEQGRAVRETQDKAEKLVTELAAAQREIQSQLSLVRSAKDQIARGKETAERNAAEQRHLLQQQRDKTEKLVGELSEMRSALETQAKARAVEEAARDNQLAAMQGELQKARAEATRARDSLEAERSRARKAEQQLAKNQESTADRGSHLPSAASSIVQQPAIAQPSLPKAPTKPAPRPEPDNRQAVRLIARADLLLEQGNIGAARNMLDRAAEMGSTEALFWLAETYDPLLLSARQTFGTQSDIAKARELYGKALAGGVGKAKVRLEELQQTGAR